MKKAAVLVLMMISAMQFGCATTHRHVVDGPQSADKIPEGFRVRIGSTEVKEGDKVGVFREICKSRRSGGRHGGSSQSCSNEKVGEASVIKVLDHDSAVVQPDAGITVEPTMLVEKL